MAAPWGSEREKTVQKEDAAQVSYAIWFMGAPRFCYSRLGCGCVACTSQIKPVCCQRTQCEGEAMQKSICIIYSPDLLYIYEATSNKQNMGPVLS